MKIAAVVLAAGGSARFSMPKQLATWHGENLVRRTARVADEAGLDPVIVVLGAYASVIEPFLSGLDNVVIVLNEEWESGQSSSLTKGIVEARDRDCDAVLVMLADQPLVEASSLKRLIAAFGETAAVIASEYAGTIGVPAIFGSGYYDELLQLSGDQGAGKWIRSQERPVLTVPVPEAAADIDTPEDLARLESGIT